MCPSTSRTPWVAGAQGRSPLRSRMAGRTLLPDGGTCRMTTMGAGRVAGRPATRRVSASTPPAEAPMTTSLRPPTPISRATLPRAGSVQSAREPGARRAAVVGREPDGDHVLAGLELRHLDLGRAGGLQRERAARHALLRALDRHRRAAGLVDVERDAGPRQRDVPDPERDRLAAGDRDLLRAGRLLALLAGEAGGDVLVAARRRVLQQRLAPPGERELERRRQRVGQVVEDGPRAAAGQQLAVPMTFWSPVRSLWRKTMRRNERTVIGPPKFTVPVSS